MKNNIFKLLDQFGVRVVNENVDGNIVCSAESSRKGFEGIPCFDYYEELDRLMADEGVSEKCYDGGVLIKFRQKMNDLGYGLDWYDCGTAHIFKE